MPPTFPNSSMARGPASGGGGVQRTVYGLPTVMISPLEGRMMPAVEGVADGAGVIVSDVCWARAGSAKRAR